MQQLKIDSITMLNYSDLPKDTIFGSPETMRALWRFAMNHIRLKAHCEDMLRDIRENEEEDHPDFVTLSRDMSKDLDDILWHINNNEFYGSEY